jgi:integrase
MARERKGSIVERNGKVYARLQFIDETGRKRDIWRRAENRTKAKEIIKRMLREIETTGVRAIDADSLLFAHLARIYEEQKLRPAKYVGERKVAGVRSLGPARVALHATVEHFGNRPLKTITHSDIERYKIMRLEKPTLRGARAIASVNRELELMRAVIRFAVREGWLPKSPFEMGTPLISKADETQRERILTHDEETFLLAACSGRRLHLRPIIITALDTGMRRGELFKLRWSDVDLATGKITIKAINTKTARKRAVAITDRLAIELERLWKNSPKNPNELVFGIRSTFKNSFATACKIAGIEEFRFHDCRHTAITRMVSAGIQPMEIMKLTGHTQMTTFARYVNPNEQSLKRAAKLLDTFNSLYGETQNSD